MHLAKRAWRALADLELAIETEQETQKHVDQVVNEIIAEQKEPARATPPPLSPGAAYVWTKLHGYQMKRECDYKLGTDEWVLK
jgi:hypothetical protein